jgi:transposase
MLNPTLLPDPELVRVEYLTADRTSLTMVLAAGGERGICPDCQRPAERPHSRYHRTLAERPWNGIPVRIQLRSRRWFCDHPGCSRKIFTERLPGLAKRYARRTEQQARLLALIGYMLGGAAGSRAAWELGMPISGDTLLRWLKARGAFKGPAPRVLGVDDFALARGQRYGTILVDLERGEPIDLLSDRSAEGLAAWLEAHPGAEIISRDRGGSYAEGARKGAPDATQVADRFHLLKNLTEALGDVLAREHAALAAAAAPPRSEGEDPEVPAPPRSKGEDPEPSGTAGGAPATHDAAAPPEEPPGAAWDRRSQRERDQSALSRERRLALYKEVLSRHSEGLEVSEIARQLGLSRDTVRKYLQSEGFPERKERNTPPREIDQHAGYLRRRWEEGCHDHRQLWQELRERGYSGKPASVWRFINQWREPGPRGRRRVARRRGVAAPSPRRVVWWLLCPKRCPAEETAFVARLEEESERVRLAHELVRDFFGLVRERQAEQLEAWVKRVEQSGLPDLVSFSRGLRRDWDAVVAGLSLPWSNGPVEGQINRVKLLKRQMYGRAGVSVLRGRVLPPAGVP